jgi:hypothetical protein
LWFLSTWGIDTIQRATDKTRTLIKAYVIITKEGKTL